ncbi:ABC transporter ATP-binding protein/permease [Idiomarina loihiensis]|uniref:ABC transporter ATP-binding protein/permease n=1 Tax=Idiomarina loihiensis TaxID=135577 RepID=UPI00384F34B9
MSAKLSPELEAASLYLKKLAVKVKRPIQWAFLFGLLKTFAIVVQLGCMAYVAQAVLADNRPVESLAYVWGGLIVSTLIRASAPYWQQNFLQQATFQATQIARKQLLERWRRQTDAGMPPSAADGALQLEPVEALKGYFNRYLVQQYLVVFSPLVILITCFYINPVVGFLLLLSGPVIPLFMALVGIGAERLSQKHAQQTHALSRIFTDKLRNLATIQLFDAGSEALSDVAAAGEEYRQATMSTLKIAFLSSAVLEFFSSVAIAGVALYVGFGLLGYINWLGADELTLFSGLFVLLLAPEYFAPLRQFAQSYHDRAAAIGAASMLAEPPMSETLKEAKALHKPGRADSSKTAIHWQNLAVQLTPELVIQYPDTDINAGTLTVVSGPSGSGKSTLVRVLLGQQPYLGVLELHESFGKERVAYFAQQPFLTASSIRNNVNQYQTYADVDIINVFGQLNLGSLLAQLPDGLDTRLGEKGMGLSGGERRRVALARCMLSGRNLIIADEPTENLDEVSAEAIRQAFKRLAEKGVTVIAASHDPKLKRAADQCLNIAMSGETA